MKTFTAIWFGQLISRLGSSLTGFALDVWVYRETNSVTQFALLTVSMTLPYVLISPVAGTLVDRWSRRWTMLISHFCAALCILAIGVLYYFHHLELWHIYLALAASSCFNAFNWTAFKAAIVTLVSKEKLPQASSMTELGAAIVRLIGPVTGGFLLGVLQVEGVIFVDFATVFFALIPLSLLRFPEIASWETQLSEQQSVVQATIEGWNYLLERKGLLGLLLVRAFYNFLVGAAIVLTTPLILTLTVASRLGIILTLAGVGTLIGSLMLSSWGKKQEQLINIILACLLLSGVSIAIAGSRPSLYLFTIAGFVFCFGLPLINGLTQVILQKKVAPNVQGRIFAINGMFLTATPPIAAALFGPLADEIFEPLLAFEGPWADGIGAIIGTGPGRGIGFLFIVIGIVTVLTSLLSSRYAPLRKLEIELPDLDFVPASNANSTTQETEATSLDSSPMTTQ
jgi:MFS family permease